MNTDRHLGHHAMREFLRLSSRYFSPIRAATCFYFRDTTARAGQYWQAITSRAPRNLVSW